MILEEAHHTYTILANEKIGTTITVHDFQTYWRKVNEKTSSSFSRLHFGHYKAASHSSLLSSLHTAKLTACARMGVPLTRWSIGLTVLLEKICGNNFIHKMRAICLLEADFNYFNKTIFARRMTAPAKDKGQIPAECYAKKGSNCVNAVITKIMYCDESRTHHHPMCIGGNDFGDCYDRIAHPPASIALQSWGVPREAIGVLLTSMQTMRFFLCTGYGESSSSYGGSEFDCNLGLRQGNAAAGPGFLALSSQIVNAYIGNGHGYHTVSSLSRTQTNLAAVICG
jgi:hypothetical protein